MGAPLRRRRTGSGACCAHGAARDPQAAGRVHPNDRKRVVRALELSEAGAWFTQAEDLLWSGTGITAIQAPQPFGLEVPARGARSSDRGTGRRDVRERRSRRRMDPAHARVGCRGRLRRSSASARSRSSHPTTPARRSSRGLSASPALSANGCGGSRGLLASPPIVRRTRPPMRSSRWHAAGNVYLLTEESLNLGQPRPGSRRRRGRHPPGARRRTRLARACNLEHRRHLRGDVGERNAHRGQMARR